MAKAVKISQETETEKVEVEKVEVKSGGLSLRFKFSKKLAVILALVVLVMLVPTAYFYNQYQSAKNLLQNPKEQTSVQNKSLVEAVGKLIELPANEQPRVATVTDVTQLSGQPFFARAKNGDKVLIFTQGGKAILYRESINKIIEVSPVSANTNPQQVQSDAAPTQVPQSQTASATVLNGTLTAGLAKSAETKLKNSLQNISVVKTGDSVGGNYQSTVVYDASGIKSDAVNQVAKLLNGKVVNQLPEGESKPASDILVILGLDYTK